MEVAVVFAAIAFAINKTVSVVKAVGKDWNLVVTQAVVWGVGIVAMFVLANAELTEAYALPGFTQPLGDLDPLSLVLLAWMAGSTGSFAYDLKTAIDGSDSAKEPALLPSANSTP